MIKFYNNNSFSTPIFLVNEVGQVIIVFFRSFKLKLLIVFIRNNTKCNKLLVIFFWAWTLESFVFGKLLAKTSIWKQTVRTKIRSWARKYRHKYQHLTHWNLFFCLASHRLVFCPIIFLLSFPSAASLCQVQIEVYWLI